MDDERYQVYSPLNFRDAARGPEVMISAFLIAFSPLDANPYGGIFLYICSCDMEEREWDGVCDKGRARKTFGVYTSQNCENPGDKVVRKDGTQQLWIISG